MKHKISKELDWRIRVFDSLSFPTLILKPDKVIVTANRVFLKKFNMDMDDVVGKTCHKVFYGSKEPCSEDICPLPSVLSEKKGQSTLREITTEKGEKKWEDRVFSPILDDQGKVIYIMESVRDVTRLKTLEKELRETKEFLEKIIHSSASAIMAADRKGNILLMNHTAEELFGYTFDEIEKATSIEGIYPPGVAKEIMKKLRDEKHGGKGKLPSTKVTIINKEGEEIPVEMTAAIIYEGDEEIATMGIYNDLREKLAVEKKLKETEAQLAQSEKMASMGQLAAGVAHEINNPLTGILFYANLALESIEEGNPLAEDLKCIIEDVHRCKGIVKNLLAYSRQSTPSKDIFQLNSLVEQALKLIHDQKLFGKVTIKKEFSNEMMLIHADKNQLVQVVINLVMNAGDAMNGEGTLTLRTYRDKPNKKAYLEVSDTGRGIPEENLSKIFDPFFTTKEQGKGTGLGLSTSYGIIQENGGSISVKETGPEGTTFLVELPLYVPSEQEAARLENERQVAKEVKGTESSKGEQVD
ncbi:MAG: PAS domain S-box protein [Deltaproteobacteria bacterium]|nr:PAS domain S-box protein [Deltaproteobacteria bacterium]